MNKMLHNLAASVYNVVVDKLFTLMEKCSQIEEKEPYLPIKLDDDKFPFKGFVYDREKNQIFIETGEGERIHISEISFFLLCDLVDLLSSFDVVSVEPEKKEKKKSDKKQEKEQENNQKIIRLNSAKK